MHSACRGHAQSSVRRCGQAVRVVSKHYHGHMRSTGLILCSVGTACGCNTSESELVVCEPPQLPTTAIGHVRLMPCAHAASYASARAPASQALCRHTRAGASLHTRTRAVEHTTLRTSLSLCASVRRAPLVHWRHLTHVLSTPHTPACCNHVQVQRVKVNGHKAAFTQTDNLSVVSQGQ
jgi:hypothetical protein